MKILVHSCYNEEGSQEWPYTSIQYHHHRVLLVMKEMEIPIIATQAERQYI